MTPSSTTVKKKPPQTLAARPLAVTLGEPAGIGPEIILKAWTVRRAEKLPPFFVIGSIDILRLYGPDIPVKAISSPAESLAVYGDALPVLDLPGAAQTITPGTPDTASAAVVIGAIDRAVELVFAGQAGGMVTAPIQKAVLYDAGFDCPGHTEYLARLCDKHSGTSRRAVMMLACDGLRVVPLTIHVPLKDVPALISEQLIRDTLITLDHSLRRDFGLKKPRIAVAGLNPHAGEGGALGREEMEIIAPALDRLRREGLDLRGPVSGDTLFHVAARKTYDTALCMYHDQALIPLKTLDFDGGVNVTLGLPIIRTSPDHGTALNIAGQGKASPRSFIRALKMAAEIAARKAAT